MFIIITISVRGTVKLKKIQICTFLLLTMHTKLELTGMLIKPAIPAVLITLPHSVSIRTTTALPIPQNHVLFCACTNESK